MRRVKEFLDPTDGARHDYWKKLEVMGRYCYARDIIVGQGYRCCADISCATGYGTKFLSKYTAGIDGYDSNEQYLKVAKKKRKGKNIKYFLVDLNCAHTLDKKYECIVSFETIEYIFSTKNFVRCITKSLKKGGELILSFTNPSFEELDENGNIKYRQHKHVFELEEMIKLWTDAGLTHTATLGQPITNALVQIEEDFSRGDKYLQRFRPLLLNEYNYRRNAIIHNSYNFAYPTMEFPEKSYSYILRFVK